MDFAIGMRVVRLEARGEEVRIVWVEPFEGDRASLSPTTGEAAWDEVPVSFGRHGGVYSGLIERRSVHKLDGIRHCSTIYEEYNSY